MRQRLCFGALLALLLTGCKLGPNFALPHEQLPDHYGGAAVTADVSTTTSGKDPLAFWWNEFHDPILDRLEAQVADGNLDLKVAFMRMVEARTKVQAARAQGLPTLNGSASYSREQLGLAGILKSQHVDAGASPTTQALISSLESPINLYQVGFDASWELDLFGKVRRSVEAANAQSAVAVEARNDLLVSLQAEVAQAYFQLRAGQALQQIVRDQIGAQRDVVDLTRNRHDHGLAGAGDVESAEAQLESLESQLPPYNSTVATSKHALAVLTGQTPEALDAEFNERSALPELPEEIPVGVPSSLARRRPDIRQSEAALHAATAQVGVAVASMFPDISLTGTLGLRNLSTGYLFDWDSKFYTFGPSISVPIFQGGALIANVRLSKAQAAEATFTYRKTVLAALQEVDDGLTAIHEDAARVVALRATAKSQKRALEIDLDLYEHGLLTYINVLSVQLQEVQARQQVAEAMLTQSTDLVKLYKALGGGWQGATPSKSEVARQD